MDDKRIRDRGKMKWTGMMLPEHVEMLREYHQVDYRKSDKPLLDEYQLQELDISIHYAMEYNFKVMISVWIDGFTHDITGNIHFMDYIKREIRLKNKKNEVEKIKIESIIKIMVED